jgi:hypothetical protein
VKIEKLTTSVIAEEITQLIPASVVKKSCMESIIKRKFKDGSYLTNESPDNKNLEWHANMKIKSRLTSLC